MFRQLSKILLIAVIAVKAHFSIALPLSSDWENTGQILTNPLAFDSDSFPYALASTPGRLLTSDLNSETGDGDISLFLKNSDGKFQGQFQTSLKGRYFGFSLAMNSRQSMIGTPGKGSVFLYGVDSGGLLTETEIKEPLLCPWSLFGAAVVANEEWMAIGAPTCGLEDGGRVYIYHYANNQWQHTQTLKPQSPKSWQAFGENLALEGSRLAVSAAPQVPAKLEAVLVNSTEESRQHWSYLQNQSGDKDTRDRVYVYELDEKARHWSILGKPIVNPYEQGEFQTSISLFNGMVAMNAPGVYQVRGKVAVFRFSGSDWQLNDTLEAPQPDSYFGFRILNTGSQLLINQQGGQRSVRCFEPINGHLMDTLKPIVDPDPNPQRHPGFGDPMSYDGTYLFSAYSGLETAAEGNYPGKIYVFTRNESARPLYQLYNNTQLMPQGKSKGYQLLMTVAEQRKKRAIILKKRDREQPSEF